MRTLERMFDFHMFPERWPLWMRRGFVLTLPLSAPAWLAGFILLCLACCLVGGAEAVAKMWAPTSKDHHHDR